jgi:hypothetical protein
MLAYSKFRNYACSSVFTCRPLFALRFIRTSCLLPLKCEQLVSLNQLILEVGSSLHVQLHIKVLSRRKWRLCFAFVLIKFRKLCQFALSQSTIAFSSLQRYALRRKLITILRFWIWRFWWDELILILIDLFKEEFFAFELQLLSVGNHRAWLSRL